MHRWVHPEFEDEEDTNIEVEAGTEEEVVVNMEENRDMVNNFTSNREEEEIVVDVEVERTRLLKSENLLEN